MPTDGFIFCVNEGFESFYSGLGKMINNYCEVLGIPQRSLRKTRKTVASVLHVNGVDDLTTDEERYEKIAQSLA